VRRGSDRDRVRSVVLTAIESVACRILHQRRPDLDPEFCRKMLRSRLEGRTPEEIARELGIGVDELRQAIDEATKIVKEAYEEALGRKKKKK